MSQGNVTSLPFAGGAITFDPHLSIFFDRYLSEGEVDTWVQNVASQLDISVLDRSASMVRPSETYEDAKFRIALKLDRQIDLHEFETGLKFFSDRMREGMMLVNIVAAQTPTQSAEYSYGDLVSKKSMGVSFEKPDQDEDLTHQDRLGFLRVITSRAQQLKSMGNMHNAKDPKLVRALDGLCDALRHIIDRSQNQPTLSNATQQEAQAIQDFVSYMQDQQRAQLDAEYDRRQQKRTLRQISRGVMLGNSGVANVSGDALALSEPANTVRVKVGMSTHLFHFRIMVEPIMKRLLGANAFAGETLLPAIQEGPVQ